MAHNPRPELQHPPLDAIELTTLLHALSDQTRLTIIQTLYQEPAGRACGTFPVDLAPSTLSHHFKVLRDSGLIRQETRGNQRWTTLRDTELDQRFPGILTALMTTNHARL